MPIKGLTDKRRLPRVGKIHLGIKAQNDKGIEYPKATDYFVFPVDHSQYDALVAKYGEKPRELRIVFPVDEDEQVASQYYRCYSKSRGLICKGDGITATRMIDLAHGGMADRDSKEVTNKEIPCEGRDCPDYEHKCKAVMNLQFMLPNIGGLGIWQIDTSSVSAMRNVNASLDMIRAVYGRISMIPLILELVQIEVTPPKAKKKNVWVMNVRSDASVVEALEQAKMERLRLVAGIEGVSEDDLLEPGIVLEVEPGDKERPDVVPDWEGFTGEEHNIPPETTAADIEHIYGDHTGDIVLADETQPFPRDAKDGVTAIVKTTGKRYKMIDGHWKELPSTKPTEKDTVPVAKAETTEVEPTNIKEFFDWLKGHGNKFTPTWFYKSFTYKGDDMKIPEQIKQAYTEIKELQGW